MLYICVMEKEKKNKFVLRMDSDTKKKLEVLAEKNQRSLNGELVFLIKSKYQENAGQ